VAQTRNTMEADRPARHMISIEVCEERRRAVAALTKVENFPRSRRDRLPLCPLGAALVSGERHRAVAALTRVENYPQSGRGRLPSCPLGAAQVSEETEARGGKPPRGLPPG